MSCIVRAPQSVITLGCTLTMVTTMTMSAVLHVLGHFGALFWRQHLPYIKHDLQHALAHLLMMRRHFLAQPHR